MTERFCRKEKLGQSCLGCPAIDMVKSEAAERLPEVPIAAIVRRVEQSICPPGEKLVVESITPMSSLRWVRR